MRVIYVDDEKIQRENFRLSSEGISWIDDLQIFGNSLEAYEWAKENPIDVALLDVEMPHMSGIELAKHLKETDPTIRIVFVTAYEQYTLEAFSVRAVGYLMKPYTKADIEKELKNAYYTVQKVPKNEIKIRTMPDLLLTVNGETVPLGHTKQEELFALLVDRGEAGITKGDALACLWEGKKPSDSTYWTCLFRLKNILEDAGVSDLIKTRGNTKYLDTKSVECDLYEMLDGKPKAISQYTGVYLRRFSWGEERIPQLDKIKRDYLACAKL